MERKLMIAPSMGCCDLFDMERQVRIIDEYTNGCTFNDQASTTVP